MPDWWITKDGDRACMEMYKRHYSRHQYADGRTTKLFMGPGEKIVLRTLCERAAFAWRKFEDDCKTFIDTETGVLRENTGVNCSIFRNEGAGRSSDLIRQADAIADFCWPRERHYTYVNAKRVRSKNPGYCFVMAGWRKCGWTKGGLLILERL